jgi:hypothetical protein
MLNEENMIMKFRNIGGKASNIPSNELSLQTERPRTPQCISSTWKMEFTSAKEAENKYTVL